MYQPIIMDLKNAAQDVFTQLGHHNKTFERMVRIVGVSQPGRRRYFELADSNRYKRTHCHDRLESRLEYSTMLLSFF